MRTKGWRPEPAGPDTHGSNSPLDVRTRETLPASSVRESSEAPVLTRAQPRGFRSPAAAPGVCTICLNSHTQALSLRQHQLLHPPCLQRPETFQTFLPPSYSTKQKLHRVFTPQRTEHRGPQPSPAAGLPAAAGAEPSTGPDPGSSCTGRLGRSRSSGFGPRHAAGTTENRAVTRKDSVATQSAPGGSHRRPRTRRLARGFRSGGVIPTPANTARLPGHHPHSST